MNWLWWLVGTVGVSGALLIAAVLVFGWPVIVGTKIGRTLLALGTAGVGILALYLKGRSEGRAAERKRQEADIHEYEADVAKKHADIDALSDDELDRRLLARDDGKQPRGR